jgi:hypothetical protein
MRWCPFALRAVDSDLPFPSQQNRIIVNGMSRFAFLRSLPGLSVVLFVMSVGCEGQPGATSSHSGDTPAKAEKREKTAAKPAVTADASSGQVNQATPSKRVPLGKNVWFENEGGRRRVLVDATVCLREGGIECFLCRSRTKEYESILSTDADAQLIHAGLLAAGAKPGSPVQYVEKNGEVVIVPPTGSRIKISVRYEDKGKQVTVPAQRWILNAKTQKDLEDKWVFAGSKLLPNTEDASKKPLYAATSDGSYICVYNMPYAMLDLSVSNPNKAPEVRELQPHTERIPPLETKVTLILEPEPAK